MVQHLSKVNMRLIRMKLTAAQKKAFDALKEIGEPASSQTIGAQVPTMKALYKLGVVEIVNHGEPLNGRECEVILWRIA